MAVWAGIQQKRLRLWLGAMVFSLILGLGNFYGGTKIGFMWMIKCSLPFDWIRQVLPQIAITHPLRLSVGGQVICVALGIMGWKHVVEIHLTQMGTVRSYFADYHRISLWIKCNLGLFLVQMLLYPMFTLNPNQIPEEYSISLAEVGTGMETSRYFWFQSKHSKPIPYTPDARLGSTGDLQTFKNLCGDGMKEVPQSLDELSIVHMRGTYQQIVVHTNLDENKGEAYKTIFTEAFGPAEEHDGLLSWQLEPLEEEDRPPELETKATVSTPYSSDGEKIQEYSCQRITDLTKALLSEKISDEAMQMKTTCGAELKQHCVQRSKNPTVNIDEVLLCIDIFNVDPTDDLQYALLHFI